MVPAYMIGLTRIRYNQIAALVCTETVPTEATVSFAFVIAGPTANQPPNLATGA